MWTHHWEEEVERNEVSAVGALKKAPTFPALSNSMVNPLLTFRSHFKLHVYFTAICKISI